MTQSTSEIDHLAHVLCQRSNPESGSVSILRISPIPFAASTA